MHSNRSTKEHGKKLQCRRRIKYRICEKVTIEWLMVICNASINEMRPSIIVALKNFAKRITPLFVAPPKQSYSYRNSGILSTMVSLHC